VGPTNIAFTSQPLGHFLSHNTTTTTMVPPLLTTEQHNIQPPTSTPPHSPTSPTSPLPASPLISLPLPLPSPPWREQANRNEPEMDRPKGMSWITETAWWWSQAHCLAQRELEPSLVAGKGTSQWKQADGNEPTPVDGLSNFTIATSPSHHLMLESRGSNGQNGPKFNFLWSSWKLGIL
jgi:hypothetical protein